eukprot:629114-Prymnesium_polylepis.1
MPRWARACDGMFLYDLALKPSTHYLGCMGRLRGSGEAPRLSPGSVCQPSPTEAGSNLKVKLETPNRTGDPSRLYEMIRADPSPRLCRDAGTLVPWFECRRVDHGVLGGPVRRCGRHYPDGLWPIVRRKAVLGRYAALRCLWHEIRDDERSTGIRRVPSVTALRSKCSK